MSKQRAKMSRSQRAKQFAPFSALNGLTRALEERERMHRSNITGEFTRTSEFLDDCEFADYSIEDTEFADDIVYEPSCDAEDNGYTDEY